MRRREFITVLGGAAAAWPFAARAQQADRMRRIGVLMVVAETDPDAKRFIEALETRLDAAGWHRGRNLGITYRWGADDSELLARYANELVLSAPDVLVLLGTAALVPLRKATTTIPIVFTSVSDPVAQGFVASLAHPGGNITGFSNFEPNIGSKWLQLLKEIAPSITHVGVLFNPRTSPNNALWMHSIEAAAPAFGVSAAQMSVQSDEDIRTAIDRLATMSGSGLIVPSDSFTFERAAMIASLAIRMGGAAGGDFWRAPCTPGSSIGTPGQITMAPALKRDFTALTDRQIESWVEKYVAKSLTSDPQCQLLLGTVRLLPDGFLSDYLPDALNASTRKRILSLCSPSLRWVAQPPA